MARFKAVTIPTSLAVKCELFKRGCFDFITCADGKEHEKQKEALRAYAEAMGETTDSKGKGLFGRFK